jgi:hypothetical protein
MKVKTPSWILQSNSPDIERLTAVYEAAQMKVREQRYLRLIERPLLSGFEIPKAMAWRPPIITTVPNTQVVIRALHTEVLRHRLGLAYERIYISEMVLVRAPSCAQKLIALAIEFPQRLVIVKFADMTDMLSTVGFSKIRSPRAAEYAAIGRDLTNAYEDEFDFDKNWKPHALDGVMTLRVGDIPRGIGFLISHEHCVPEAAWADLDMQGVHHLVHKAKFERKRQNDHGAKFLEEMLKRKSLL